MLTVPRYTITAEQVWRRERERKATRTEAPHYASSGETDVKFSSWLPGLQARRPTVP